MNVMLFMFTEYICSEMASTFWVLIITKVPSMYLNQLVNVGPLKVDKVFFFTSSM